MEVNEQLLGLLLSHREKGAPDLFLSDMGNGGGADLQCLSGVYKWENQEFRMADCICACTDQGEALVSTMTAGLSSVRLGLWWPYRPCWAHQAERERVLHSVPAHPRLLCPEVLCAELTLSASVP